MCRDKPEYSCEQNDFENIYSLKIAAPYQQHETYYRSYGWIISVHMHQNKRNIVYNLRLD